MFGMMVKLKSFYDFFKSKFTGEENVKIKTKDSFASDPQLQQELFPTSRQWKGLCMVHLYQYVPCHVLDARGEHPVLKRSNGHQCLAAVACSHPQACRVLSRRRVSAKYWWSLSPE